jgi:hypothetical protein
MIQPTPAHWETCPNKPITLSKITKNIEEVNGHPVHKDSRPG